MGKSEKPEGFVVYSKTLQSALLLPDESAGRVLKAAARLFLTGEAPAGLELSEEIVLSLFTGDIESALHRHAEVCARNQRIAANRRSPVVTSRDESSPVAPNRNEPNRTESNRTEKNRTETESKKNMADKPPRARFVPPTLEDVEAYCAARHSPVDPERFFAYFEAGGWKDAKGQAVKNWKQKLLTWENRERRDDDAGRNDTGHGRDAAEVIDGVLRL